MQITLRPWIALALVIHKVVQSVFWEQGIGPPSALLALVGSHITEVSSLYFVAVDNFSIAPGLNVSYTTIEST